MNTNELTVEIYQSFCNLDNYFLSFWIREVWMALQIVIEVHISLLHHQYKLTTRQITIISNARRRSNQREISIRLDHIWMINGECNTKFSFYSILLAIIRSIHEFQSNVFPFVFTTSWCPGFQFFLPFYHYSIISTSQFIRIPIH